MFWPESNTEYGVYIAPVPWIFETLVFQNYARLKQYVRCLRVQGLARKNCSSVFRLLPPPAQPLLRTGHQNSELQTSATALFLQYVPLYRI